MVRMLCSPNPHFVPIGVGFTKSAKPTFFPSLAASFEAERKKLLAENKRWRFIAKLDCGMASIKLQAVDSNHPAFNLAGTNNIVLLTTERYNKEPMVIRGYGAGAEVTAAGVFADAIRIANV